MSKTPAQNTFAALGSFVLGLACDAMVIGVASWLSSAVVFLAWPAITLVALPVAWTIFGLSDGMTRSWINACRIAFIFGWFTLAAAVVALLAGSV